VPELILGVLCKTPGVKLQDLIIACELQQWSELVDVYAVLCGNPTHYSVTAYGLGGRTRVSYIGRFEGIWPLRTVD